MLIKEYNTLWIKQFKDIKFELQSALIGLEYTIEHIGSTSVPNLASKAIIDIDIIHQSNSEFGMIKSRLLEIGYFHNGNQGIEEREVFKRNGIIKNSILDNVAHHLYVCPIHSLALKRHILFRDALRNNKFAKKEYQKIKYELARKANQNRKVYAELKEQNVNNFIDKLIGIKNKNNECAMPHDKSPNKNKL